MNILVTGGGGFIGSNFVRMLVKNGEHRLTNFDKLTYSGNFGNLKGIEDDCRFVKGDVCDAEAVEKAAKDAEVIINFAAECLVEKSIIDAAPFIRTNFYGTHVLLEAARKHDAKFVQVSSDKVYGSIERGNFKEEDTLEPSNPYASTKAAADLLTFSYYRTYKLPVTICRSSNNYGPYQNPEKLIPLFITNALENRKMPLYGSGKNIRDWIYVQDNCEAIETVMNKGKMGEIYNIATGNEKQNIEIAKMIAKKLGKGEELIQSVEDRPGHDFRYSLNTTKIRTLGWKPKHSFEEGIEQTIKWYKENSGWWKKLKKLV